MILISVDMFCVVSMDIVCYWICYRQYYYFDDFNPDV